MDKRICPQCGKEIEPLGFCPYCGAKLTPPEQAEPAAEEQPPAVEAAPEAVEAAPAEVPAPAEAAELPAETAQTPAEPPAAPAPKASFAEAVQTSRADAPLSPAAPLPYPAPADAGSKRSKKLLAILLCAVIVITAVTIPVSILSSDSYKYKKSMQLLADEKYEEAFEILYALGDYEDAESYLPFHGKYVDISVSDNRTLTFTDGKYEKIIPGSKEDSYYHGVYSVDGYDTATLTDEDDDKSTFQIFRNCIYDVSTEDFVFDGKLKTADGTVSGTVSETMRIDLSSSISMKLVWEYTFRDDGTYTYSDKGYSNSSSTPFHDETEAGAFTFDGNLLTMTNSEGKEKTYLVLDGLVYRDVYIRDYSAGA